MNSITIPVGIDVSKDTLDVFIDRVSGRKRMKVSNDEEGVRQILCELEVGTYKVAMEATGRYEVLARRMLEEAGLAVSSLNPRLARHMAIGFGVEAKTDPIDAEILARLATVCKPTDPRSQLRESLGDTSRTVSTLILERSGHKKRLQSPGFHPQVAQSLEVIIAVLDTEIARLEKLFVVEVRKSELAERYKLAQTVPGVGPAMARVLTSELPEDLSRYTTRQICSYAGLTPVDNASGKSIRKSKLKAHGNMFIKAATYMPAVSLLACDPKAMELYRRSIAQGREHQQALVPVMHRLLRRAAAVIKRGSPWRSDPPATTLT
jgi:transposase